MKNRLLTFPAILCISLNCVASNTLNKLGGDCELNNSDYALYSSETNAYYKEVSPPVNDNCSTALELNPNSKNNYTIGTIQGATKSSKGTSCLVAPNIDLWYKFVAKQTRQDITLDSKFIANITVYKGTCESLVNIKCTETYSYFKRIKVDSLTIGETYFIKIHQFTDNPPTDPLFNICVHEYTPAINNECAGAISIPVDTVCNFTSLVYKNAYNTFDNCRSDSDLWYKFTANQSIEKVKIEGSNFFPSIGVYKGTCGNLETIFCNPYKNFLLYDLDSGEVYYLSVGTSALQPLNDPNFFMCIQDFTPASNDLPENATTIPLDSICNFTTGDLNYASKAKDHCNAYSFYAPDLWYKFVATDTIGLLTLQSDFTPFIEVYHYDSGGLKSISCSIDTVYDISGKYLVKKYLKDLKFGDTYYLAIGENIAGSKKEFKLCLQNKAQPNNDLCSKPVFLDITTPMQGTLELASNSIVHNSFDNPYSPEVWYKFATNNSNHKIQLNSSFPALIEVFEGNCDSLVLMETILSDYYITGKVLKNLVIGKTYYISVSYQYNKLPIDPRFTLTVTNANPPINDECLQATNLLTSSNCIKKTGTLQDASNSIEHCADDPYSRDVWYKFTPSTESHILKLDAVFFVNVELFKGDCSNLVSVVCINPIEQQETLYNLDKNETYYIAVETINPGINSNPSFSLCVFNNPNSSIHDNSLTPILGPNPVDKEMYLRFTQTAPKEMNVYNINGQLVIKKSIESAQVYDEYMLDVSILSPGIYTLEVIGLERKTFNRFIKK